MRIVASLAAVVGLAACSSAPAPVSGVVPSNSPPPVDPVTMALQQVCPRLLEDPARFPAVALENGFDWYDFSDKGVRPFAAALGVSISASSGACVVGFATKPFSAQQLQQQWEFIRDLTFVAAPPLKTVTAPGESGIYGCSDAPPRTVMITVSSGAEPPETLEYNGTSFTRLGRGQPNTEMRVIVTKDDCAATENRIGP